MEPQILDRVCFSPKNNLTSRVTGLLIKRIHKYDVTREGHSSVTTTNTEKQTQLQILVESYLDTRTNEELKQSYDKAAAVIYPPAITYSFAAANGRALTSNPVAISGGTTTIPNNTIHFANTPSFSFHEPFIQPLNLEKEEESPTFEIQSMCFFDEPPPQILRFCFISYQNDIIIHSTQNLSEEELLTHDCNYLRRLVKRKYLLKDFETFKRQKRNKLTKQNQEELLELLKKIFFHEEEDSIEKCLEIALEFGSANTIKIVLLFCKILKVYQLRSRQYTLGYAVSV